MWRIHVVFICFCSASLLSACTRPASLVGQPAASPQPTSNEQEVTPMPSPLATLASTTSSLPTAKATPNSPAKPTQTSVGVQSSLSINQLPSAFSSDDTRMLSSVDTIVIHSLYNPEAKDPFSIQSAKAILDKYKVSTHYIIDRNGKIYQLVAENRQAWHAGEASMPAPDGRSKVNLFSIGIELIGSETSGFTDAQYSSVVALTLDSMNRLPIKYVTGHGDIAPGRKTDPWKFEWSKFETAVKKSASNLLFVH